jgi:oxaloacetate decarboxylase (Na+ extruding) subunit gamma
MLVIEGLKLMVIGMGLVYIFLLIMVGLINIMAAILRPYTLAEEAALKAEAERIKAKKAAKAKNQAGSDMSAVISAAVAHHRSKE